MHNCEYGCNAEILVSEYGVVVRYGLEDGFISSLKVVSLIYGMVKQYDARLKLVFTLS